MKKRMLTLILAGLLVLLTACGSGQEDAADLDTVTKTFKVMEVREQGLLALKWDETQYLCFLSPGSITDSKGNAMELSDLRPGMMLEVTWNGLVLESWPAQVYGSSTRVIEQGDDLVGLYRQVLHDLWDTDPALNHDVTRLGLDFSGLTNLTGEERRALEYLFACDVELFAGMAIGTWQKLCEAGLIDGENLYWEDGVFLSISVTEEGNGKFTFDAQKWRSGTGAIYFNDCRAIREKDGQWRWEADAVAIA